ncbi:hypothetical protein NE865_12369 [Phthorimaea operculella]|nr:hypothetical protein NE865_12369 [Phthorimaea operculella]
MRAKRVKRISSIPKCSVSKKDSIDEEVPKVIFKINPAYPGRITRSIKKVLDYTKDFMLIEIYRCMPLLGDEDMVPNWDIHICRYAVVFTGNTQQ